MVLEESRSIADQTNLLALNAATEEQGAVGEGLNRNVVNISSASEVVVSGAARIASTSNDIHQLHGMVRRFKV